MNLGPVTELDKANTSTLKKFYDDVMLPNCDVIAFFPIYGQFATIRKIINTWSIKPTFS